MSLLKVHLVDVPQLSIISHELHYLLISTLTFQHDAAELSMKTLECPFKAVSKPI